MAGMHIHVFMLYPTSFISNKIQIDQFEKKSAGQNNKINEYTPQINVLALGSHDAKQKLQARENW